MAKGKHRAGSPNHSKITVPAPPAPAALPEPPDNPLRSPVNRRNAIKTAGAAGVVATDSLRSDGSARQVPALPVELISYFDNGQAR